MPDPDVYEQEYTYWPWGRLLAAAGRWVTSNAPASSRIVDYMCGTGYLLDVISRSRPDLQLVGCDISQKYVEYANIRYPNLDVRCCNALEFVPEQSPHVVLCTAGLHHLARTRQGEFVEKVATELSRGALFLVGEELIRHYQTESERRAAALEMGSALISYAIKSNAPGDVLAAALDVLGNDLLERGEYKISDRMLTDMLQRNFDLVSVDWIWHDESKAYGDVLYVFSRR